MIGKQDKIKRIRKRTDDNKNIIKTRRQKKEKIKTIIRTQYKQIKKERN